ANPTADVEGIDACRKICILGAIAFGKLINPSEVSTKGISKIRLEDVKNAAEAGYAIKLIGQAKMIDDKMSVSVAPRLVSYNNLLSKVDDVFNGVLVTGNAVDDVLFIGRGAGKLPTASAVVADIIDIAGRTELKNDIWDKADKDDLLCPCKKVAAYYVAANVDDNTAKDIFGNYSAISLRDGEFSFITEKMTGKELEEKLSKLGDKAVSVIEVL
ncbi:MAG: homoserine dehydrogenase, partial [Clostridia bacterium]|nr:homoserine dehydrogenase [Clostridia bacterium]